MSRFIRNAAALTLSASTLASLPAVAADELHYNQIALRAEVSQEVARDKMIVTLYTESQNADPAKLAADITTTMNQALGQAREVKAVTLRQAAATATRSTTIRIRRSPVGVNAPNCAWRAQTSRRCPSSLASCSTP